MGGAPRLVRRLLCAVVALGLVALVGHAAAQDLDADTILDNVEARASTIEDARFLLTGAVYDPGGAAIALEIDVQLIPGAGVASAYIVQPDALADNVIVLDGDAVYNYVYLTNQVTIFDADDPDALGGLLGDRSIDEDAITGTLDVRSVLVGYEVVATEAMETPVGPGYRLRFENSDPDAAVPSAVAEIVADAWLPYRIEFFQADGERLAELVFENVEIDVGLDADDVTYLPEDAEVFDERE